MIMLMLEIKFIHFDSSNGNDEIYMYDFWLTDDTPTEQTELNHEQVIAPKW